MKKITSLLLCLIFAFGSFSEAVFAANIKEGFLLYDDFEDYRGGIREGWSWFTNPSDRYEAVKKDALHGTSLSPIAVGANTAVIQYDFSDKAKEEGSYLLSFSFRSDNPDGLFYLRLLDERYEQMNNANDPYMHETFNAYSAEDKGQTIGFYQGSSGWTRKTLCEWEGGKWYEIDLWIDRDNQRITYGVNGECLGETDFAAKGALTGLLIFSYAQNDSAVYFDNLSFCRVTNSLAEEKSKKGDFVPQEFLKSVSVKAESANVGNIFFDDEPAAITLRFENSSSQEKEVSYKAQVTNLSGETVWNDDGHLSLGANGEKSISVSPKIDKFGLYRLKVYLNGEEESSETAELSRCVKNTSVNEKIGACVHFDRERGEPSPLLYLAQSAGIGITRCDWPRNEKTKGVYSDYYETDGRFSAYIKSSEERGIGMYCIVSTYVPESLFPSDEDGGFNTSAESLAAFRDFSRYIAEKFKGKIEYFEIGNEVNYTKNKNFTSYDLSDIPEARDYAEILSAAYDGIKSANPDAKVVAFASSVNYPGIHSGSVYEAFIRQSLEYMKSKGRFPFDAVSVHPYHQAEPPCIKDKWIDNCSWTDNAEKLNKVLSDYGIGDKEKIASELGYSYQRGSDVPYAAYMIRMAALNEANGYYDKLIFYDLQDDGTDPDNSEHNYGMLGCFKGTDTNYAAKEFYLALSQWNKLMNAASFEKDISQSDWELGKRFSSNGKIVDVIWNTEEHLSWRKNNERSSERTVTIGTDAVSVYDLYGNLIKSAVGSSSDSVIRITAGAEPLYVVHEKAPATRQSRAMAALMLYSKLK